MCGNVVWANLHATLWGTGGLKTAYFQSCWFYPACMGKHNANEQSASSAQATNGGNRPQNRRRKKQAGKTAGNHRQKSPPAEKARGRKGLRPVLGQQFFGILKVDFVFCNHLFHNFFQHFAAGAGGCRQIARMARHMPFLQPFGGKRL